MKDQPKVLMIALVQQKKIIKFSKENTSLLYDVDENYLHVNKTEICEFKAKYNISLNNFCLGSVSKDFTKDEQSEISLNDTVYDFSVDHS